MKKTVLIVIALLGGAVLFSGCKNNDGGGAPVCQVGTVWNGSTCIANGTFPGGYGYPGATTCTTAGTLQTQYGCLPIGSCPQTPTPMAMYNGQCVPGTLGGVGTNPYGNQYLGGTYPNGYPGAYPYGSTYNQYPFGYNYYWYWGYGF